MPQPTKRWAAFAASCAVLLLTPLVVTASDSFSDVPDSNVHHDDITWLGETGVTKGCNPPANTNYCPEDSVTRQQMASFLRRLAENRVVDAATAVTAGDADTLDGLDSTDFLAGQAWSESMPVETAFWYEGGPVAYEVAGGGSSITAGLTLDNSGFGRFHHGFTLPPAYTAGSDVNVRIGWAAETTNATGCGFTVEVNSARAFRPGNQVMRPTVEWENPATAFFADRTVLIAPASPGPGNGFQIVTQETYFTIDGASLQPGDQVSLAINRDQDETGDSCLGKLIILGMTAEPA